LEESASVFVFEGTWSWLEAAKENARRKNKGDNQAYTTTLGGMEFQIKPHGGDGVAFILSNDLFTVAIRPAEVDFNLSVTYRACVLWQYGVHEARRMIWAALLSEMKPRPLGRDNPDAEPVWRKVTRVDFAFDFQSSDFTGEVCPELVSQVVCHAEVLKECHPKVLNEYGEEIKNLDCELFVRGIRTQTITIGKGASLEIQIYNKSDEVTAKKSGKKWMYKIWAQSGHPAEDDGIYKNVWRIEVRFSRAHLAARHIDDFEDFEHHREALLSEALTTRRLCDIASDTNRRRWPVHPLWGAALEQSGRRQEFRPIGRQTERDGEIVVQEAVREAEAALRRIMVVRDIDKGQILKMMEQIVYELDSTEKHDEAMERLGERYKYLDHAR
jgi:hypothetical protein